MIGLYDTTNNSSMFFHILPILEQYHSHKPLGFTCPRKKQNALMAAGSPWRSATQLFAAGNQLAQTVRAVRARPAAVFVTCLCHPKPRWGIEHDRNSPQKWPTAPKMGTKPLHCRRSRSTARIRTCFFSPTYGNQGIKWNHNIVFTR
jgi:hypothetical protein